MRLFYKSYVRPVIEYADVVWHSGLTYKQAGDLERIQIRACRTILGHQFSTYTESIKQCNLDRLSERRVDHCLKFARGLVDNPRTSHLLPPTRISTHGRNLRNANKFPQPKIKTNRFKQSPIPYFVFAVEWTIIHSLVPSFPWLSCPQGWVGNGGGGRGLSKVLCVNSGID